MPYDWALEPSTRIGTEPEQGKSRPTIRVPASRSASAAFIDDDIAHVRQQIVVRTWPSDPAGGIRRHMDFSDGLAFMDFDCSGAIERTAWVLRTIPDVAQGTLYMSMRPEALHSDWYEVITAFCAETEISRQLATAATCAIQREEQPPSDRVIARAGSIGRLLSQGLFCSRDIRIGAFADGEGGATIILHSSKTGRQISFDLSSRDLPVTVTWLADFQPPTQQEILEHQLDMPGYVRWLNGRS